MTFFITSRRRVRERSTGKVLRRARSSETSPRRASVKYESPVGGGVYRGPSVCGFVFVVVGRGHALRWTRKGCVLVGVWCVGDGRWGWCVCGGWMILVYLHQRNKQHSTSQTTLGYHSFLPSFLTYLHHRMCVRRGENDDGYRVRLRMCVR